MEQTPFQPGRNGFADNPEPRCATVLLLDVSESMTGAPLAELQAGLALYREQLAADSLARKRIEVAIITFGGSVQLAHKFATADQLQLPELAASGQTPMAQAVLLGLNLLDERKAKYRANGIQYYRPWVFLITDGAPTDANTAYWNDAIAKIRQGEDEKAFSFFAVGVENADMNKLQELSFRTALKLKGLRFGDLFRWLSNSQQLVSRSTPGDSVPLPNPAAPDGWASV